MVGCLSVASPSGRNRIHPRHLSHFLSPNHNSQHHYSFCMQIDHLHSLGFPPTFTSQGSPTLLIFPSSLSLVLLVSLPLVIYLLHSHPSLPFLNGIYILMFMFMFWLFFPVTVSRPLVSKLFQSRIPLSKMFWYMHLCDVYQVLGTQTNVMCIICVHITFM